MGIRLPPPRRLLDIRALATVEEGALAGAGNVATAQVVVVGAVRIGRSSTR